MKIAIIDNSSNDYSNHHFEKVLYNLDKTIDYDILQYR